MCETVAIWVEAHYGPLAETIERKCNCGSGTDANFTSLQLEAYLYLKSLRNENMFTQFLVMPVLLSWLHTIWNILLFLTFPGIALGVCFSFLRFINFNTHLCVSYCLTSNWKLWFSAKALEQYSEVLGLNLGQDYTGWGFLWLSSVFPGKSR